MFEVEYKGGNSVVLTSKKSQLYVDPNVSVVGLKSIKVKDEVELLTETRLGVENADAKLIIDSPGEYEVGDFTIRGVAAQRHIDTADQDKMATVYHVETSEVRVGVIGNIDAKLSEDQLEQIGIVDVLIIPVGGGGYTLDATSATTIVRQVEPKVVIPVHYADSSLSYEVPQDTLETFVKELGAPVETLPKLKFKTSAAIPPVLTVYELTRS
jgi:L-ascorbate metabolism protein UlaG (beta-lactamase superfamily)